MCGIWGFISKEGLLHFSKNRSTLYNAYSLIQKRGPDRSEFFELNDVVKIFLGFHRLAIMDKTTRGDQPFVLERDNRTIYCLCNGEIYEHHHLIKKYNLQTISKSDCEVIPLIYEKYGIDVVDIFLVFVSNFKELFESDSCGSLFSSSIIVGI